MNHLHVHTNFSLLDGLGTISQYITKAQALGQTALAITDHGFMSGVFDFWKACKDAKITALMGEEFYVVPEFVEKERQRWHVVLIAKNQIGFKNLIKLSTLSFVDGYYYKPRINHAMMKQYNEGIICLSACEQGEIPWAIRNGNADLMLKFYKETYQDLYLELQPHDTDTQKALNIALERLGLAWDVPFVITGDIHYPDKKDAFYHDYLMRLQHRKTTRQEDKKAEFTFSIHDLYMRSETEMINDFVRRNPEISIDTVENGIVNTEKIAEMVEPIDIDTSYKIPKFKGEIHFSVPAW